jgi:predicted membrane protein (TIGR00267 family)
MRSRIISASYLQNFVFGVEDSLVSTVGLLSGVAAAGMDRSAVFMTGAILIFVEAFSMAVGSYLSNTSVERYMSRDDKSQKYPLVGGVIMFFSYFLVGFIPLFPYLVWTVGAAFMISMFLSVMSLFILGLISGKITGEKVLVSAFRMAIIGALAIGIGVIAGRATMLI